MKLFSFNENLEHITINLIHTFFLEKKSEVLIFLWLIRMKILKKKVYFQVVELSMKFGGCGFGYDTNYMIYWGFINSLKYIL